MSAPAANWICRIGFALVFAINVTCAIQFIAAPQGFVAAYELEGPPGIAAVQGMGICFLMWNATYPAFIVSPKRFRALGTVIIAQQAIGCIGEACILATLPAGYATLASSIVRFLLFDAAGLALMLVVFIVWLRGRKDQERSKGSSK